MTQDELARRLNVSFQSVSKWERGESEPSLSMLPIIACLFNVSTDEIYDMDEIKRQQRIDELNAQIKENYVEHKVNNNIPLIQEVLDEYPDSPELMFELGKSYFLARVDEEESVEYFSHAIELFNRVLELTDDEKLIADTQYYLNLSCYYSGKNGYSSDSNIRNSRDIIRSIVLTEELSEKDRDMALKKNIASLTLLLARQIWKLADPDCLYIANREAEERGRMLMKSARLLEWLYEDGDFYDIHLDLSDIYRVVAAVCIYDKRCDDTIEALEKAAEHAMAYDSIKDKAEHTSLLINGMIDDENYPHDNNGILESSRLLESKMSQERYDILRSDERFIAIVKKLESFINDKKR
ncbi:MAG: helix-turn-helix transcriptional regulator [Lachnospiraceae bacterium]|nr:helix-turn-helix transcriptional regulator [Lachnospiraceae bacterium]